MSIVIVEGVDRIGKSSACQFLVDLFGFKSMHFSKPAGETVEEKAHYQMGTFDRMFRFMRALEGQPARIVMDRGHLGELVYGPMYRGESRLDLSYIHEMERDYGPFNDVHLILMVNRDLSVLKARDDGLGFDIENIEREQEMFEKAFEGSLLTNKVLLDVTGLDLDQVRNKLSSIINPAISGR